jgi:hypothetical protein
MEVYSSKLKRAGLPNNASDNNNRISTFHGSDYANQSCKHVSEPSSKIIFATPNICILRYEPSSSLKNHIFVYTAGPSTIDERNAWINEAGNWLKRNSLNACSEDTIYLNNSFGPEPVRPPLESQIHGIPGEKAFYMLGGLERPKFCSHPCIGNGRPNHLGRCPPMDISQGR